MNKTLHIIPDLYYAGSEDYTKKIENVPMEERDNAGFWYLHGKLEELLGFDKAIISNCKTLGISKPFKYGDNLTTNKLYLNGIYPCEVEGIEEPCVGYFWATDEVDGYRWMQRGLVCLKSDETACQYAEKKMNEKSFSI